MREGGREGGSGGREGGREGGEGGREEGGREGGEGREREERFFSCRVAISINSSNTNVYQKWTISVCVCAVLQNYYTTISGFDKGVCSACISHEKVLPMQIEYMKLMHLVLSMYMGAGQRTDVWR